MKHKAGFVNIIGNPNAGKSTLMNALVGEKLSIITSKAQTTRHRIMGIVNHKDFQIVYSDTPGILKPGYALQESMMKFVNEALQDADILLYVTSMDEQPDFDDHIFSRLKKQNLPSILIVNKIDLASNESVEERIRKCNEAYSFTENIAVSAKNKTNTQAVIDTLLKYLPEHPEYFPKDELTDKSMRFFVSEIIREKILLTYSKEIPYCSEVIIDSYKDEKKILNIRAEIIVSRDSQKGIVIGHQGSALKKVGSLARIDIEEFVGKKVFLELHVKVDKDWRMDKMKLKRYGYE